MVIFIGTSLERLLHSVSGNKIIDHDLISN